VCSRRIPKARGAIIKARKILYSALARGSMVQLVKESSCEVWCDCACARVCACIVFVFVVVLLCACLCVFLCVS
jgi:hypothetical protein